MSVVEESRVPEDDLTHEFNHEDRDKDMKMKNLLKTNLREKRMISPLALFKEDFSQLKEEVLKVFKDKDTKTEHEDAPSNQTNSTLSLLREDLSQFKEDVTSIFSISLSRDKDVKYTDSKTAQSAERTINPLSLLKEDLSSVFRISLSKEKDNKGLAAKEDSSKTNVLKAERTDDPLRNLFRRDQQLSKSSDEEDSRGVKETVSEQSEDQRDDGSSGELSEQSKETVHADNTMRDRVNGSEDSEVDIYVSEEKSETTTSLSEKQGEETMWTSQTADQRCASDDDTCVVSGEDAKLKEDKEEDEPSDTLPWETLFSGISLFTPRDAKKDDMSELLERDMWSVKNFACYLTFDPSTANSELLLSDCNRKVTRVWSDHRSTDHPDRFECCPQVLCREGLLDSAYWELEWIGGADIGVTYNSISRDGDAASCLLGHNERSWSLECSEGSYTPCYNTKRFRSSSPEPFTHRIGVYLNWSAGSLSFYCVSQDAMVHLHTFTSTFTEPLYPGFWVWAYDGSVSLRQVELDWERLLQ